MNDEKRVLLRLRFSDKTTSYYKVDRSWVEKEDVWNSTWVRLGGTFINMEHVMKVEVEDLDSAWGESYE